MDQLVSRLMALWARVLAGPAGPLLDRVGAWWRRRRRATTRRSSRIHRRAAALADAVNQVLAPVVRPAARLAHEVADAVRPGQAPISYTDGMVTLDDRGIVISRYYLPVGRRLIEYDQVRSVREFPMSGVRAFRVHGFSFPRYWLHRDSSRGERRVALELRTDGWLRPLLTPVDVQAVTAILRERTGVADRR